MYCDLHMHSTASDGTFAPGQLATLAQAAGVAVIALTDHDTTAGLQACAAGCLAEGIGFVPGIELSADPAPVKRRPALADDAAASTGTLHILGLFVRHDDPGLAEIHVRLLAARQERNPQIIRNLQNLGVTIEYDEVLALAQSLGTKVVGRPHIAQVLVNKGYAKTAQDAFARYIGEGKPAYARKDQLPPDAAIAAIHRAGGLAILAHPIQLKYADDDHLDLIVARLKEMGLDGIEARHTDHTPALIDRYQKLADRLGLATSGGSDFHGSRKAIELGNQKVPLSVVKRLEELWRSRG